MVKDPAESGRKRKWRRFKGIWSLAFLDNLSLQLYRNQWLDEAYKFIGGLDGNPLGNGVKDLYVSSSTMWTRAWAPTGWIRQELLFKYACQAERTKTRRATSDSHALNTFLYLTSSKIYFVNMRHRALMSGAVC